MNAPTPIKRPLTRTEHLGWALVKASSTATHYSKVQIIRSGKRFTWVRSSSGMEWRETTRGLWTFETEAAADAELDTLAQIWRDHLPKRIVRAPKSRTEHLEEARVRQAGRGFVSPFLSVTDEQLARADADIGARLTCRPKVASGFKLTPYGLERIAK